ncbi:MAG TPA: hypothetical protein VMQ76_10740 [Terracidiphilus sp.]|jgi:hypothetical protein|nr:hypothetical protein [Terracidiphilus sp.]
MSTSTSTIDTSSQNGIVKPGYGLDLGALPSTEFTAAEFYSPTSAATASQAIQLRVNVSLTERRIYCYLSVKLSSAAWYRVEASVQAFRLGRLVADLPCVLVPAIAGLTDGSSSFSLFANGGTAVGDTLTMFVANPFDNSAVGGSYDKTVALQPMRINGEIDELRLKISRIQGAGVTGIRAALACLSCLI